MISLEYKNSSVLINNQWIAFSDIEIVDINLTTIFLDDSLNNAWYGFLANETTINGILQTSAQMIFDTLSSDGQS